MNYETLMSEPLERLALFANCESFKLSDRITCYEALCARVEECESLWGDMSRDSRALILGTLALDLSAENVNKPTGESREKPAGTLDSRAAKLCEIAESMYAADARRGSPDYSSAADILLHAVWQFDAFDKAGPY